MQKLNINKTKLDGVLNIIPPTIFEDHRGSYVETYNEKIYNDAGIKVKFVQDDSIFSYKHVLRGIHYDNKTWKLISCLHGEFYLVIANCNKQSNDFGKWISFTLSETNRTQVLVPPKNGVVHLVLSDTAIFHYKQTSYFEQKSEGTYRWDDPIFNITWPIKDPILSERDLKACY